MLATAATNVSRAEYGNVAEHAHRATSPRKIARPLRRSFTLHHDLRSAQPCPAHDQLTWPRQLTVFGAQGSNEA
jgi:hypothetical protein